MPNFTSGKIQFVFPSAVRGNEAGYTDSRLFKESTIANMYKLMNDNSSFVISKDTTTIEFILEGYYFKLDISGYTPETPLYVGLSFNSNGELAGDSGAKYTGLSYGTTKSTANYFQLLDAAGEVPASSYVRINSKSLPDEIDYGEY